MGVHSMSEHPQRSVTQRLDQNIDSFELLIFPQIFYFIQKC